jgi:hypothetical protein
MLKTTFTRKVAFRCMMSKKGCAMHIWYMILRIYFMNTLYGNVHNSNDLPT